MTSVPPAHPALAKAVKAPSLSRPARVPFAALVETPTPAKDVTTYGFSVLGVFGRHPGIQEGGISPAGMAHVPGQLGVSDPTTAVLASAKIAHEAVDHVGPPAAWESHHVLPQSDILPPHEAEASGQGASIADAGAVKRRELSFQEPSLRPAGRTPSRVMPERRTSPQPAALRLSREMGILEISARAFELSPDAKLRLRQLIEEATAGYGLTVETLTLNGEPQPRSPISIAGEKHGRSTG